MFHYIWCFMDAAECMQRGTQKEETETFAAVLKLCCFQRCPQAKIQPFKIKAHLQCLTDNLTSGQFLLSAQPVNNKHTVEPD